MEFKRNIIIKRPGDFFYSAINGHQFFKKFTFFKTSFLLIKLSLVVCFFFISCKQKTNITSNRLFQKLDSDKTGIDFNNKLGYDAGFNITDINIQHPIAINICHTYTG